MTEPFEESFEEKVERELRAREETSSMSEMGLSDRLRGVGWEGRDWFEGREDLLMCFSSSGDKRGDRVQIVDAINDDVFDLHSHLESVLAEKNLRLWYFGEGNWVADGRFARVGKAYLDLRSGDVIYQQKLYRPLAPSEDVWYSIEKSQTLSLIREGRSVPLASGSPLIASHNPAGSHLLVSHSSEGPFVYDWRNDSKQELSDKPSYMWGQDGSLLLNQYNASRDREEVGVLDLSSGKSDYLCDFLSRDFEYVTFDVSHNDKYVSFHFRNQSKIVSVFSGDVVHELETPSVSWAPHDCKVAYLDKGRVSILDVASGEVRKSVESARPPIWRPRP